MSMNLFGRQVGVVVVTFLIGCRFAPLPQSLDSGVGDLPPRDAATEMAAPTPDAVANPDAQASMDMRPKMEVANDRPPDRPVDVSPEASHPDAAPPPMLDAKPDAVVTMPDAMDVPPVTSRCGNERPDLSGVLAADGLAIDADGTIYYSHVVDFWEVVGRIRPGGLPAEPLFVPIVGGQTPWGLAIDSQRRRLYVASPDAWTIFVLDLKQPQPTPQVLFRSLGIRPNDLAIGPNGDLYFSDQSDNRIHRIDLAGVRTVVTPLPLTDPEFIGTKPSALVFASNGDLLVGSRGFGNITRIVLAGGVEMRRYTFGAFVGWVNGFAFDERGRLYVSLFDSMAFSDLLRVDPSGITEEAMERDGRFSSLAFGRGALHCNDLYVADLSGGIRRLTLDAVGVPVP